MVVEDDVEMNELQRELLAVHGLDTVAAYTGTEALEVCSHCKTDAVLLDIMLPEMDGFQCCELLKRRDGKKVPVVIVTALDSEDCRRRGFEAGADGTSSNRSTPMKWWIPSATSLTKPTTSPPTRPSP